MNTGQPSNKTKYKINLQPTGRRIKIDADQNLLEAARRSAVEIISLCGGIGACDSCKIRVVSGLVSEPSLIEGEIFDESELKDGFRLACQVYPLSDLKIEIPAESLSTSQRLQLEGQNIAIEPSLSVTTFQIQVPKPTLNDLRSDSQRIKDEIVKKAKISQLEFDYRTLKYAGHVLRENQWRVCIVLHGNRIIAILPHNSTIYGIAVDIGTTKLAAYLVDLSTGSIVARAGSMNPQISYGEDVISRIAFTNSETQGRQKLQRLLIDAINDLIAELSLKAQKSGYQITRDQIIDAVVVGNTAMHHLFTGLPVEQLGSSPYVPSHGKAMLIPSRELGLQIGEGAQVYLPPVIAGYIGADHVAMLIATSTYNMDETCIALDIGTNTEITLRHEGKLYSCSCASGPAFEGAHIKEGMRAAPGAIERVQIEGGEIRYHTIGSGSPIGICGSGILDAVAEMLNENILDRRGRFMMEDKRVIQTNHEAMFILVDKDSSGNGRTIYIHREDVNEIQLAKGAIRTGIETLLKEAGIEANHIKKFIIAGAFGTYLGIDSAVRIGMFPSIPQERYFQVGNAAGNGAVMLLLSKELRSITETIVDKVRYIELSNHPIFHSEFAKALLFDK